MLNPKNGNSYLTDENIGVINRHLQEFVDHPVRTIEEHAAKLAKDEEAVHKGICPLCGGELMLRISTRTGRKFWGCVNYPNCMFRKDL